MPTRHFHLLPLVFLSLIALVVLSAGRIAWAQQPGLVGLKALAQGGLFFPSATPDALRVGPDVRTHVVIRVDGILARAIVRQTFRNPTDSWTEALYVVPLPEAAAVDALRMTVGDRIIEGEIQERQEAERDYAQAAEAGQAASLLQQNRANLFTNKVANIPPDGEVTVEIGFDLPVDYSAGRFALRFPMVVNPRYEPLRDVVLAAKGAAEPLPAAPYDKGGSGDLNPLSLRIDLHTGFPLAKIESATHEIVVGKGGADGKAFITLADGTVPADRDFEVTWRRDCQQLAAINNPVVSAAEGRGAAAKECQAPFTAQYRQERGQYAYHLMMLLPGVEGREHSAPPRDILFVVDTSGSMGGQPMEQARQALDRALARLRPQDRFEVITFNDRTARLFGGLRPATAGAVATARRATAALEGQGGTEMRPALKAALAEPAERGRLRQIVFLTDAAIADDAALLALIQSQIGSARLYPVALGAAPNGFFMREAAVAGRGAMVAITDHSQIAERLAALLDMLEAPALTDLTLRDQAGASVSTYPARLPDLHAGQVLTATFRLPADRSEPLFLRGRRNGQPWQTIIEPGQGIAAENTAKLWGRKRLAAIDRKRRLKPDVPALERQALETAMAFGLLSADTALVAIDPEASRPKQAAMRRESVTLNFPAGTHQALQRIAGFAATASAASLKLAVGVVLLLGTAVFWIFGRRWGGA